MSAEPHYYVARRVYWPGGDITLGRTAHAHRIHNCYELIAIMRGTNADYGVTGDLWLVPA